MKISLKVNWIRRFPIGKCLNVIYFYLKGDNQIKVLSSVETDKIAEYILNYQALLMIDQISILH